MTYKKTIPHPGLFFLIIIVFACSIQNIHARDNDPPEKTPVPTPVPECNSSSDCIKCKQVCLNGKCTASGMEECEDGRCVTSSVQCYCPPCKPCEEDCNSSKGVCEPSDFKLCVKTGDCIFKFRDACPDQCDPPCKCNALCSKGIVWGTYCSVQTIIKNSKDCQDGTCANPDKGESCPEDCPQKCDYCLQKCVYGKCEQTFNHICWDGSCKSIIDSCPQKPGF